MMKKIFIVGLIVCSFFVVSVSTVIAAETHTVSDDTGDVIDYAGDPVSGKNNIDLKELTFTKNNKQVELKIELAVGGIIQNSDYVYYEIYLVTSENRYDILYTNNSCIVADFEQTELEDVEYSGDGTGADPFTISFNLYSDDERYMSLYAVTSEITDEDEGNYYFDSIPDGEFPTAYATFLETGKTGESIEFSAETDYGTPPYSWNWDFGDGETSDEQNTNHTYAAVGTYKVTLLVTDSNDYSDIYYATLNITANDNGNQNGGDNKADTSKQESPNSGLILFVVIIVAIVIAGIAVIIYVIRR